MSTRSFIGQKIGADRYRVVYCHWDGYLEYNGRMLVEHYNTQEKVDRLLSLGCISSLREKLEPEQGSTHCFETPDKDVTVFYGRDRKEKGQEAFVCNKKKLTNPRNCISYIYIYDNGIWFYSVIEHEGFTKFEPLVPAIEKIKRSETV